MRYPQAPAPSHEDTLRSQLFDLQEANAALMSAAETEGRDLTQTETQEFDNNTARFTELEAHLARVQTFSRQRDMMNAPMPRLIQPRPGQLQNPNGAGPTARTIGAQIVANGGFREWVRSKSGQPLEIPIRAATTWPAPTEVATPYTQIGGAAPGWVGVFKAIIPEVALQAEAVTWPIMTAADFSGGYQQKFGDPKKAASLTVTATTRPMSCIAEYLKVPLQLANDWAVLQSFLDSQLLLGLNQTLEMELANGTGSVTDQGTLAGVVPAAVEIAAPATGANIVDCVRSAVQQVAMNGFRPSAVVFSPSAWELACGAKSTQGEYLFPSLAVAGLAPYGITPAEPTSSPFAFRAYVSFALEGVVQFVAGDFANASILFVNQQPSLAVSYSDQDDFIRNLMCLRIETRCSHIIAAPKALAKLTAAPAVTPGGLGASRAAK